MAEVIPIRGLRYTAAAGNLADLITPPYDVIDTRAQENYYKRHPYNVIRLEYGLTYPTDNETSNRYTRAAATFAGWQAEGILQQETRPAFYYYEVQFRLPDQPPEISKTFTRRGFYAGVRLTPYEEGLVLPHEETLPKHKADRLALMRACAANFSPIFGLYLDREQEIDRLLLKAIESRPPVAAFHDDDNHFHRLWVIDDPATIASVQVAMRDKQIFIADGHHRYETALYYREERRKTAPYPLKEPQPFDYVLMTLVNLYDPGIVILPTHRLVHSVDPNRLSTLIINLEQDFLVEELAQELSSTTQATSSVTRFKVNTLLQRMAERSATIGTPVFGLYLKESFFLLTLRHHPSATRAKENLDVYLLHRLVLEKHLGIGSSELAGEKNILYTRDAVAAVKAVDEGQAQAAFFLNPTPPLEVISVAREGDKMPQKSTYFYPKLITGLVIYKLDH